MLRVAKCRCAIGLGCITVLFHSQARAGTPQNNMFALSGFSSASHQVRILSRRYKSFIHKCWVYYLFLTLSDNNPWSLQDSWIKHSYTQRINRSAVIDNRRNLAPDDSSLPEIITEFVVMCPQLNMVCVLYWSISGYQTGATIVSDCFIVLGRVSSGVPITGISLIEQLFPAVYMSMCSQMFLLLATISDSCRQVFLLSGNGASSYENSCCQVLLSLVITFSRRIVGP